MGLSSSSKITLVSLNKIFAVFYNLAYAQCTQRICTHTHNTQPTPRAIFSKKWFLSQHYAYVYHVLKKTNIFYNTTNNVNPNLGEGKVEKCFSNLKRNLYVPTHTSNEKIKIKRRNKVFLKSCQLLFVMSYMLWISKQFFILFFFK